MKMTNFSSRDMAINAAEDMSKALQTPLQGSTFQVGDYQLKAIRELDEKIDAEIQLKNRYELPPPTPPTPY